MSINQNQSEEINLGQLFKLIENAFNKGFFLKVFLI